MTSPTLKAAEVEFIGVSKRYGFGPIAIDKLDLTVRPGEFLTLLGPSGSGKTTALNLLAGFQMPTSGQILIDGADISALPAYKRNIGVVFQHYALFPHMTVRENVGYPLKQRRVAKDELRRRVDEALRMVAIEAFADRLPRQLSGGQQQRVAVARAFVFQPRLLLMDEPLGALDRKLRESVQLELKRIHRELGVTVVFVTHDQEEALVMSDRVAVFDAGKIQQVGTASELYDAPLTKFVAQFLGESNCWVGDVTHQSSDRSTVSGPGWTVKGTRIEQTPSSGRAAVVVRPERCSLVARGDAPAGWNEIPGLIRDIVYLGSLRKVVIDLEAGGTAVVSSRPETEFPLNRAVSVAFPISSARTLPAAE
ncbi:ABC transporter ATP-binding protein [Mesorhizobium loti]|uniref:ABC transporter ATP-binding protein n=1 Tax=Rhizobium loti TaxID=381 RepID=UPI000428BBC7|nr:ABC transporter ATP-binding protein [Mesorhizobium loti]